MSNLVNRIERYLKALLEDSPEGVIELQRNDLALEFGCVPSQINYVLSTRFTVQHGYLVESRRGGGGFVRLIKLPLRRMRQLEDVLRESIGERISPGVAEGLIVRLLEEGLLTRREALILRRVIDRSTLLEVDQPDRLRARILQVALLCICESGGD
ncbi:MAG: CtsR family transcriptional regulator [Syntrophomonadaceae bacterium]|nr:CtsR family transcriptional regulator [Syntrophomonadaceae bacterium]